MPKAKDNITIPTHGLESAQDPIVLRSMVHKNPYDFTQLHRHGYFEVMFFVQGGGKNLIDFIQYDVKSNACHLICPGQVHLLRRSPESWGWLIQFSLSAISSPKLQQLMQERVWSGAGAIMFEDSAASMAKAKSIMDLMETQTPASPTYRHEIKQHLLQALLFELFSLADAKTEAHALDPDFYQFLQLIDRHFKEEQTVGFYLDRLTLPEKRLATMAQKYRGLTPLQIIHQRLLLEAKRLLAAGNQPHKEIAYDLGFDSPASFSTFIKKKTGHTASEIQAQVTEIPIQ